MGAKAREASGGQVSQGFRNDLKGSSSTPRAMGRHEGFKEGSGHQTYTTETSSSR